MTDTPRGTTYGQRLVMSAPELSHRLMFAELTIQQLERDLAAAKLRIVDFATRPPLDEYMALRAELAAAQADAERYRHFRDNMDESTKLHMIAAGTDYYDSYIDNDAAIKEKK